MADVYEFIRSKIQKYKSGKSDDDDPKQDAPNLKLSNNFEDHIVDGEFKLELKPLPEHSLLYKVLLAFPYTKEMKEIHEYNEQVNCIEKAYQQDVARKKNLAEILEMVRQYKEKRN